MQPNHTRIPSSQRAQATPFRILTFVSLVMGGLLVEGCSAFYEQNEFLTHLQSKRTPSVNGVIELDAGMTRCSALAREARIYYKMCELAHQPQDAFGWYARRCEACCGVAEQLRQSLSKELGREVLRIDGPPDADEMPYIKGARLYVPGILLGGREPTEQGVKRAVAEFSKVPADCSSGYSLKEAIAVSSESRQLRESYDMLQELSSNVTPGVQGTVVVDRDFANCSKAAREIFIYHGFCQMKLGKAPGWFPPDACERAEKARRLLSLSLGKEVVGIEGIGNSEILEITSSRRGAPVSGGDIERFVGEFTQPPPECESGGN